MSCKNLWTKKEQGNYFSLQLCSHLFIRILYLSLIHLWETGGFQLLLNLNNQSKYAVTWSPVQLILKWLICVPHKRSHLWRKKLIWLWPLFQVKDLLFYQSTKSYLLRMNLSKVTLLLQQRALIKRKKNMFCYSNTFGHIIHGISCTCIEGKEFGKPQFWKYLK